MTAALARPYLAACFVAMFALAVANALGTAMPSIAAAADVPVERLGFLPALTAVGGLLGVGWWGRAQGRVPTARLLGLGAGVVLVAQLLIVTSPAARAGAVVADGRGVVLGLLGLATLLHGCGFGVVVAGITTVVAHRGASPVLLNVLHGTYGVGAMAFPFLVGATSLRVGHLVAGALLVPALVWLRGAPAIGRAPSAVPSGAVPGAVPAPVPASARARARASLAPGTVGRAAFPYALVAALAIGVEVSIAAWAPTHLEAAGMSVRGAGGVVSAYFAAFTLGRFAVAPRVGGWDLARVVRSGLAITALGVLGAMVLPWPAVGWVLAGLGTGPMFPTILAWLVAAVDDPHATARMMVGGGVTGFLLPLVIGGSVAVGGAGAIPVLLACVALTALVVARRLPSAVAPHGRGPGAVADAAAGPSTGGR